MWESVQEYQEPDYAVSGSNKKVKMWSRGEGRETVRIGLVADGLMFLTLRYT